MNKRGIVTLIASEVEDLLEDDPECKDLEEMENQVRDLMKGLGQKVLQRRIEQRAKAANGGFEGHVVAMPDGSNAYFDKRG